MKRRFLGGFDNAFSLPLGQAVDGRRTAKGPTALTVKPVENLFAGVPRQFSQSGRFGVAGQQLLFGLFQGGQMEDVVLATLAEEPSPAGCEA